MQRKCDERSMNLFYWLRAYRYASDMTLMQALEENLGYPTEKL